MAPLAQAPLFSLVMPTYGVENYVADAVADILTQTFQDFELIIVDDCSPDRSVEVALAVAGDDPRVRIVRHPENRWVSAARNTGIDKARGTWILFPDPDDRYETTLLERVAATIAESETDLVVFGHVQEYFAADGSFLYRNPVDILDGAFERGPEMGRAALTLEKQTNLGYPWNKAYRLDVIRANSLEFEDGARLIEDILFNVAYLHHVEKITCIPDVLYRYAKRLGSNLTNELVPDYYLLHRRRIREVRDLVEECGALDERAKATLGALYARYILSALEQNTDRRSGMNHAARVKWLESVFDDPLFHELVLLGQADDSRSLALCLKLLKSRNVPALLASGRAIHIVRSRNTTLYTKAKSRR